MEAIMIFKLNYIKLTGYLIILLFFLMTANLFGQKSKKAEKKSLKNDGLSVKLLVDSKNKEKEKKKNNGNVEKGNLSTKNVQNTVVVVGSNNNKKSKNDTKTSVSSTKTKPKDVERLGAQELQLRFSLIGGILMNEDQSQKRWFDSDPFMWGIDTEFLITDTLGIKIMGLVNLDINDINDDPIYDRIISVRTFSALLGTYHFRQNTGFDLHLSFGFGAATQSHIFDPKNHLEADYNELDPDEKNPENGVVIIDGEAYYTDVSYSEVRIYAIGGVGLDLFFDPNFFVGTEFLAMTEIIKAENSIETKTNFPKTGLQKNMFSLYFKVGYAFNFGS